MTDRDRQAAVLYDAILTVTITASMRCPCVLRQVQDDLRERLNDNHGGRCWDNEEFILKDMIAYLERLIAEKKDSPCHS